MLSDLCEIIQVLLRFCKSSPHGHDAGMGSAKVLPALQKVNGVLNRKPVSLEVLYDHIRPEFS